MSHAKFSHGYNYSYRGGEMPQRIVPQRMSPLEILNSKRPPVQGAVTSTRGQAVLASGGWKLIAATGIIVGTGFLIMKNWK